MIIESVMSSFRFGSVTRLIGGYKRVIKSAGTVDYAEISIIYGTPKSHLCTWTDQVATSLPDAEVRLFLSANFSSKHYNKIKKSWVIKGYQKWICCIHLFILMQRPYQHICSQGKLERYLVPLLLDQIGLGTQLRIKLKGGSHESFDVSDDILKLSLRARVLMGNY